MCYLHVPTTVLLWWSWMCGALICLMAEKTSLSCRKLSFTQQVVDVSQGSCTQHEKCHHLYSCIPSTRAWLNCTSTWFMHVACMHSTCTCCAKHTCIRLHGHMHTFSISCRHLDHNIWYMLYTLAVINLLWPVVRLWLPSNPVAATHHDVKYMCACGNPSCKTRMFHACMEQSTCDHRYANICSVTRSSLHGILNRKKHQHGFYLRDWTLMNVLPYIATAHLHGNLWSTAKGTCKNIHLNCPQVGIAYPSM